jgi:type II secretory pathway pseudopilin PulG
MHGCTITDGCVRCLSAAITRRGLERQHLQEKERARQELVARVREAKQTMAQLAGALWCTVLQHCAALHCAMVTMDMPLRLLWIEVILSTA